MNRPGIWWIGLAPAVGLWLALIHFETEQFERDLSARAAAVVHQRLADTASIATYGRDISVEGLIFDESARAGALEAVAAIPGARIVSDALSPPPPLSPFSWRAVWDGASLTLSGGAPSPADRAALVAAAKAALPQAHIVDEMAYASGASPDFAAQAAKLLPALARLQSGAAQRRGGETTLTGQAATDADYQATLDAAAGLAVKSEIVPPRAANFSFEAENDGRTLRLSGFVGAEADRAALLAEARRSFPDVKIADALKMASGAPPRFAAEADFALRALSQLKKGKVTLSGHEAHISGLGRPGADAQAFAAALPAEPGVSLDIKGVAAGDNSPYVMNAEKGEHALVLSGFCGDEDSCSKIRAEARAKFPGLALTDSLRRGPAGPKGFATAALEGLDQLARLRVGRLALRDASANLRGDAVRAAAAEEVKTDFIAAMPEGFAVQADVTGAERQQAAPPPSPGTPSAAAQLPSAVTANVAAEPPSAATANAAAPPPSPVTSSMAAPPLTAATPSMPAQPPSTVMANVAAPPPSAVQPEAKPERYCKARLSEKARAATIQFGFGSAEMTPETSALLDALVAVARECSNEALEISGHADDVGRVSRNIALSWRRAEAVAAYLLAAGVEPRRLNIEGFGETRPSAPNDSEENRAKNRRIEIQVK